MSVGLPSGTVTFLFTDIEGSTQRWEEQPDTTSAALARHDHLLRAAVAANRGVVFSHGGDGMTAAFERAGDAIAAAAAAQRTLQSERLELRVRMAVHTGEAEERDGNYFGPALNRAARLMGLAEGGHVLVSLAAAEVVRDRLPAGLILAELGERSLRSLSRPERVFELTWTAPAPSEHIEIGLLGPLRLAIDGVDVVVPGPKRRAVLALLAMASPGWASVDSLVATVWPDGEAASGSLALQSHISRLRRHLGPAAKRLETGPGGYRLRLEPGELDATRAKELIGEARRGAPTNGSAALTLVREARCLWRGRPLEEFSDVGPLAAWRQALDEQRLAAADLHAELAIASRDFDEAVQVASATVAEDGLREASVLIYMRALAGSGRAAEALRAAHVYRRLLADKTGLVASGALAELEHEIAIGEPQASADANWRASGWALPGARSTLIGRDAELAGIARLVQSDSLVTLVGPGGVGKTSLALATARGDRSERDVAFVSLAPVTDPSALPDVLAASLGLRGSIGDPLAAALALLGSRPWLVVLDNCEHLLHPVRQLVATLTGCCAELTVLATSRERLGLSAERVCRVAPLALPADDGGVGVEDVPAVAMFFERANRVRNGFEPDGGELALVAGIVRRLDGVPLAIELAAGRLASLSIADLSSRLDRALDLLSGATDTEDDRHATLRAAIEWSYELLPQDQQRLFRNLAIFPDGFDLLTAEAVASEVAASVDPTAAVAHLVDASMLEATLGDQPRYGMLDTLRSFGLDRLAAHQEQGAAMARFVEWARSFVRWVDETTLTADEPLADRRLLAEVGNLRAAWHHARSVDDLDLMADLIISLNWPVQTRDLTEPISWAIELAGHPRLFDHPRVASVLATAADACWQSLGDLNRARSLAEQGLSMASEQDPLARPRNLMALGDVRLLEGRFEEAVELLLEAGQGTPWHEPSCSVAALATAYRGRLVEARILNHEVASATCPSTLAFYHYVEGEIDNLDRAWNASGLHYRESMRMSELSGATFFHALAKVGLVSVHANSGNTQAALRGYGELIDYWERTGGWTQQWTTLRNLADLLDQLGDRDCAAMLRRAANEAPEAASTGAVPTLGAAMPGDETNQTRPARAVASAREQALDAARHAITRHLTTFDT